MKPYQCSCPHGYTGPRCNKGSFKIHFMVMCLFTVLINIFHSCWASWDKASASSMFNK